jgi:hypothetical protein
VKISTKNKNEQIEPRNYIKVVNEFSCCRQTAAGSEDDAQERFTPNSADLASGVCRGEFSHSRSCEGPKPYFNILALLLFFCFILVCYFSAHMGLLFPLIFK